MNGELREGKEVVALLGTGAHHAAFDRVGETLWVLTATHLHRIDWKESPTLAASFELETYAAALRDSVSRRPKLEVVR